MVQERTRNKRPKTLPAFGDATVIGIYKCSCGCVHYGISEQDAVSYVTHMESYLTSLEEQDAKLFYGGRKISVEIFKKCFFCRVPSEQMTHILENKVNYSISHQPVIVSTSM